MNADKTPKTPKRTAAGSAGFTEEERAAMREHARELRLAKKGGSVADEEADVLAKIAEMPAEDRHKAERIHALVKAAAPELTARTWYGMPAYAKDGKIICHFQPAQKFKTRYPTLGFSDRAQLDDGNFWPVAFAVKELTAEEEARITALVKKAVG
ncbi:MAG TPA: hypothetical protein VHB74_12000 [Devosia sp.]|nr:hypothetical protein [Devosia sp.]